MKIVSTFGQNGVRQHLLYITTLDLNSVFDKKYNFLLFDPYMSFFKFLKPFPILQNISLPTTQNKGRFSFTAFQTFTRKSVKSNRQPKLLAAMLSKESTAKNSFNLEDTYLGKALYSQYHRITHDFLNFRLQKFQI